MAAVPKGGVVAVTGAAGFVGGWVVHGLVERGYRVRACVRDVADESKVGFLRAMGAYASGRLTLYALPDGSQEALETRRDVARER